MTPSLIARIFAIVLAAAALAPQRIAAQPLTAEQQTIYALAFSAAEQQRWDEVRRALAIGTHPLANKILRWMMMLSPRGGVGFDEIAAFIRDNPRWPSPLPLQRRAEETLAEAADDGAVRAFFAARPPITPEGTARLALALRRAGEIEAAGTVAREFWRRAAMSEAQERAFLSRVAILLTAADHAARLDRMIWDGRIPDARRLFTLVDGDTRKLAEARIAFATRAGNAERLFEQVPQARRDDPALTFERARYLRRRGRDDEARTMFLAATMPAEQALQWKRERLAHVRRLAELGDAQGAYALARDHGLNEGADFAEAEFLAGWLALRRLNEPDTALPHFVRLYEGSQMPITRARGAYWAGRAREAAGNREEAAQWYRRAAAFPVAFYGQVALSRLNNGTRPEWPSVRPANDDERVAFEADELVQAARLLNQLGATSYLRTFVIRLAQHADSATRAAQAADLALEFGRNDIAVTIAKRATMLLGGIVLPVQGWPIIDIADNGGVEPALVLSIIRQESAFETRAVSRAGARGLMQLMPTTARAVARRMGMMREHTAARLIDEPIYNIRLGANHLGREIEAFGGSYVLAIAAYNAGGGRAVEWVRRNGDPRSETVDVIDWIESIPFDETRNYVQRVMENLMVYRWRLQPGASAGSIEAELRRRRGVLPPLPEPDETEAAQSEAP